MHRRARGALASAASGLFRSGRVGRRLCLRLRPGSRRQHRRRRRRGSLRHEHVVVVVVVAVSGGGIVAVVRFFGRGGGGGRCTLAFFADGNNVALVGVVVNIVAAVLPLPKPFRTPATVGVSVRRACALLDNSEAITNGGERGGGEPRGERRTRVGGGGSNSRPEIAV